MTWSKQETAPPDFIFKCARYIQFGIGPKFSFTVGDRLFPTSIYCVCLILEMKKVNINKYMFQ